MSEEKRALTEFKGIIECLDVEKLLVEANEKISASLKRMGLDSYDADLFEIIAEGIKSKLKKSMYIVDAKIGEDKKLGFAIQFEDNEGEIVDESAYYVEDGKVSVGIVNKVREMAYMDYELRQGRDREIVKVF